MPLLTPDTALLTATAGLFLIFLELNRPGLILPGVLGLLLTLLAAAALLHYPFTLWAVLLLIGSMTTLALNLYRVLPLWLLALATAALAASLRCLVNPKPQLLTALPCGVSLGLSAAILSRIALRARRAKAIH